jgi:transposase InsO family protein
LPNKSAIAVMNHLKIIFSEFGKPKIIQHDCGKEFSGQVKRLLQKLKIKDIKSRPYHPQSQGKVERMHKHLKQKKCFRHIKCK